MDKQSAARAEHLLPARAAVYFFWGEDYRQNRKKRSTS